jgi:predicted adenylyl cyclase CyaB
MPSLEIEIKSLLGDSTRAAEFKSALLALKPEVGETSSQLNHYFVGWNIPGLYEKTAPYLSRDDLKQFQHIREHGANFSVRTRQMNDQVLLIVKASIDDTTSANGIARREFEGEVTGLSLDALDTLVIEAGFEVQAKWSRYREQYRIDDITVTLDKNAGYGYLAEFEIVVEDAAEVQTAKAKIYDLMQRLQVQELPQDRLERMFAYYNSFWVDYYGTDKTFVIE